MNLTKVAPIAFFIICLFSAHSLKADYSKGNTTVYIYKDPGFTLETDMAYVQIFSTPTGQKILREVLLCHPDIMEKYLGLHRVHSIAVLHDVPCSVKIQPKEISKRLKLLSDKKMHTRYFSFPKEESQGFDSWTYRGVTDFFRQVTSRYDLIKILVHELGIHLNRGFQYKTHLVDKILEKNLAVKIQKNDHYFIQKSKNTSKDYTHLLSSPFLSSFLSSLRAFDLEYQLVKEVAKNEKVSISEFYTDEELKFMSYKCHSKLDYFYKKHGNSKSSIPLFTWELSRKDIASGSTLLDLNQIKGFQEQGSASKASPLYYKWKPRNFPKTNEVAIRYAKENLALFKELDPDGSLCRKATKFEVNTRPPCQYSHQEGVVCNNNWGGPRPRIQGGL